MLLGLEGKLESVQWDSRFPTIYEWNVLAHGRSPLAVTSSVVASNFHGVPFLFQSSVFQIALLMFKSHAFAGKFLGRGGFLLIVKDLAQAKLPFSPSLSLTLIHAVEVKRI